MALPTPMRVSALALVTIGLLTSIMAVAELEMTLRASELTPPMEMLASAVLRAQFSGHVVALEAMQWVRVPVLALLSVASSVAFFTALRVRWPGSGRRVPFAELMAKAAIVSAVLRTVDGAQLLLIAKRAAAAGERALAQGPAGDPRAQETALGLAMIPALSVAATLVVVGLYVTLGRYFQSPHARSLLAELDANVPEEEE